MYSMIGRYCATAWPPRLRCSRPGIVRVQYYWPLLRYCTTTPPAILQARDSTCTVLLAATALLHDHPARDAPGLG